MLPTFYRLLSHSVLDGGEQYGKAEGVSSFPRRCPWKGWALRRGTTWRNVAQRELPHHRRMLISIETVQHLCWPSRRRDNPTRGYCFKRICKS